MFRKIHAKHKEQTSLIATLDHLGEALQALEKKESIFLKKAAGEQEKAKEFVKLKNKKAALQCLKMKKLYEQQAEQLGNQQLRIHDQMIMLEGAQATTGTLDALRTGSAAMKAIHKSTNIDHVDETMNEINEQMETMRQMQEALSSPIASASYLDEDELEAELEELEGAELEEMPLQPAAANTPEAPEQLVPAGRQPTSPASHKNTAEMDELAELQSQMAI